MRTFTVLIHVVACNVAKGLVYIIIYKDFVTSCFSAGCLVGRPMARSDRPLYNPIGKALPGLAMAVVNESSGIICCSPLLLLYIIITSVCSSTDPDLTTTKHPFGYVILGNRRKSRDPSPAISLKNSVHPDEEIPLGTISSKGKGTSVVSQNTSTQGNLDAAGSNGSVISMNSSFGNNSNSSAPGLRLKFPCGNSASTSGSANKISGNKSAASSRSPKHSISSNSSIIGVPNSQEEDFEDGEGSVTTPQSETSFMTSVTSPTTTPVGLYPTVATAAQVPLPSQNNADYYSTNSDHTSNVNHSISETSTVLSAPQFYATATTSGGRKKKGAIETV